MDPVDFVFKAVLSASPSLTPNYVLMVIHGAAKHLGFWRPGGENSWTVIETRDFLYEDVIYYKGQFYALSNQGSIFVWDVGGPNPTVARRVGGIKSELLWYMQPYLVESGAELLVVARYVIHPGDDTDPTYETTSFKVYEVDLSKEARWQEINNLGGRALFLGHSASISVDASRFFPAIKPNGIYYTDDYMDMYTYQVDNNPGGGKDMGVYNLEDGSKEPLNYKGESLSYTCPPAWILSADPASTAENWALSLASESKEIQSKEIMITLDHSNFSEIVVKHNFVVIEIYAPCSNSEAQIWSDFGEEEEEKKKKEEEEEEKKEKKNWTGGGHQNRRWRRRGRRAEAEAEAGLSDERRAATPTSCVQRR
ncbi:hypothetical protein HYC85_028454 [Camellia sinensis]|uniref:KIB1-4 beta-propeller domain-containing protein n=1 Tax=Camellia sinensis TaxID=4442 RepID=A0A7J7FV78_CAMSI|nr:hypothetical protein HYC85_028454 [Camellia sinensis]